MGGRDHSCEDCGRGGFNDPDGVCECPDGPSGEAQEMEEVRPEQVFREPAPDELCCDCMCSNCHDDPHYSSYHCKHHGDRYGDLESAGFCHKTGFMPRHSWRRSYKWGRGKGEPVTPGEAQEGRVWSVTIEDQGEWVRRDEAESALREQERLSIAKTPVQCFLSDLDLIAAQEPKSVVIYTEQIQKALEDSGLLAELRGE